MEAKCVSSILLFSLLTLVVCNNVKTAELNKVKFGITAEEYNAFTEQLDTTQKAYQRVKKKFDTYKAEHPDDKESLVGCESALAEYEQNSDKHKDFLAKFQENSDKLVEEIQSNLARIMSLKQERDKANSALTEYQENTEQFQEYFEQSEDKIQSSLAQIMSLKQERDKANSGFHQISDQLKITKRKLEQYQKREAHKETE